MQVSDVPCRFQEYMFILSIMDLQIPSLKFCQTSNLAVHTICQALTHGRRLAEELFLFGNFQRSLFTLEKVFPSQSRNSFYGFYNYGLVIIIFYQTQIIRFIEIIGIFIFFMANTLWKPRILPPPRCQSIFGITNKLGH